MDLCSHAGLLTKVLQEVIGNDHKGKERKWWMVEPSGEPTTDDWIELMGQEKHYIVTEISNVGLPLATLRFYWENSQHRREADSQMSQNESKHPHPDFLPILH